MYLDVEGINSLHSQIVKQVEDNVAISNEKRRKARISGGIGLGGALGSLLGLLDLKSEVETASSRATSTTVTTHQVAEQKLGDLILYLEKSGESTIFSSLPDAALFVKAEKDAVFLQCQLKFDAPQFCFGNGVSDVNQTKSLVFEHQTDATDNYNPKDDYYKEQCIPVVTSASIEKTPNCHGRIGVYRARSSLYFWALR